jgi:Uma2 family endonuclease
VIRRATRCATVPAVSVPKRRATYDDLVKVPEQFVAEIIDGELYTSPRPAFPHARSATALGSDLFNRFDGPPGGESSAGWWILFEPELHLGEDVLVPDVAGWRRDKVRVLPDVVGFTRAPDWVCEVVSRSTATIDRVRKMRIYAREPIGHLWIVDPILRTLEVYRLEDGRWIVASAHGGDETARAEPFDAAALDLTRWWMPRLTAVE